MSNESKPTPHNAPVFYKDANGKPINTGLKKAALEDYNRRLITDPNKQR